MSAESPHLLVNRFEADRLREARRCRVRLVNEYREKQVTDGLEREESILGRAPSTEADVDLDHAAGDVQGLDH